MYSLALLTFFVSLFTLSVASLFFVVFSLFKGFHGPHANRDTSVLKSSLSRIAEKVRLIREKDRTRLAHSLFLEIEPSDSGKWDNSGSSNGASKDAGPGVEGGDPCEESTVKKKKKRGKKKKSDLRVEEVENWGEEKCGERVDSGSVSDRPQPKPELLCVYPFTSMNSSTQRKIKQHYDQLVKCHEAKGLTLTQVADFANCLVESRNELQQKSQVIKRKYTITKALLVKAHRSSFDRLRQQVYKLETEQKRLEEDAFVYNWLQEQLKLSPAYKKMLEISSMEEPSDKIDGITESPEEADFTDISFEELLAQEKKDSFWRKNGRWRTSSS